MDKKILRLRKMGSRSALITAALLLFGLAGLLRETAGNWLVTIFKLLAGFQGVQPEMLYRLNGMDILLLALLGVAVAGLSAALWQESRLWCLVAAVQPPVGIVLFLATQSAGRSAFMGSVLVISLVMLRSRALKRWTAWAGILASALLFAGDFLAGQAPFPALAPFFAAGYALMVFWLFAVGAGLNSLVDPF